MNIKRFQSISRLMNLVGFFFLSSSKFYSSISLWTIFPNNMAWIWKHFYFCFLIYLFISYIGNENTRIQHLLGHQLLHSASGSQFQSLSVLSLWSLDVCSVILQVFPGFLSFSMQCKHILNWLLLWAFMAACLICFWFNHVIHLICPGSKNIDMLL